MQKTQLGDTPLRVTPIGLGLAALGRPGYINLGHASDLNHKTDVDTMREHSSTVLDAAWDAGIRYVDAARSYGKAEAFLAHWLQTHDIDPESITIGSKWGYTYTADWQIEAEQHEVKDHSLSVFQRQIEESREHLAGYLGLYQVHSATLSSGILTNDAVLDALAALKADGRVIGLTLSGSGQADTLRKAMDIMRGGERLFQTVQATWNILERSAEDVLKDAHDAGMGVIIKEAVANGRLTSKNTNPDFAEQRHQLESISGELGVEIDALALAAVISRPWVDVTLSGAATVEHLRDNLQAMNITWSDDLEQAIEPLVESPDVYWATRANLDWN